MMAIERYATASRSTPSSVTVLGLVLLEVVVVVVEVGVAAPNKMRLEAVWQ